MPESNNKPAIASLTDIATAFAAYVAVPAALFYPIGFLSRWLQIYYPYDIKIQTAWHATAVIDKIDVIGQGALVLVPPLVLSILLSMLLGNIIYVLTADPERPQGHGRQRLVVGGLIIVELVAVGLCLLAFKAYTCALLIGAMPWSLDQHVICLTSDWRIMFVPYLGYLLGCTVGGYLICSDFVRVLQTKTAPYGRLIRATDVEKTIYWLPFINGRSLRERWILRGLAVAYVVSILAVLLLSPFLEEPSLPRVSYGPENGRKVGLLLSHHADGRWYILHSDVPPNPETFEAEGQWATEMLALSDAAAGDVRFLRADPETVYAHKGASMLSHGLPTHYPGDVIRIELDMMDDESGVLAASVRCHQEEESGTTIAWSRKRQVKNGEAKWVVEKAITNKDEEVVEGGDPVTWPAKHGVEKGGNQWVFEMTVTNKTPTGTYLCENEDITVSDAHGNEETYEGDDMRFVVGEDEEEPDIQEVQISVARP